MHPANVVNIHERILNESSANARYIDIREGHKLHVIEAGKGPSLVMLHGTGAAAHTFMPLIERLDGIHAIVPDRPGFGLSDPIDFRQGNYRHTAVEVVDEILDALGLEQVSLAGSSGGSVWAIWYALARPERVNRLVLVGGTPLLPDTKAPLPLRLMATPVIGHVMAAMPANETMVKGLMGFMGEKETIGNYPKMLEALTAANNDPIASEANRMEMAALLNLLDFKAELKIQPEELAGLSMPTLLIWGENDPLGGETVARTACNAISECQLEMMQTGHVPWLGYPDKTAKLISDFVLSQ